MPTIVHGFDWPDRLVVGTIGHPGSRSFYLQARDGTRVVSVALEKEQSAALAETIDELLDELMAGEGNPFSIPAQTPVELIDNEPLDQPVQPEFQAAAISLGWDPSTMQIVIEAYPFVEQEEFLGYDDTEGDLIPDDDDDDDEEEEIELLGGPEFQASLRPEPPEMLAVRIPVGTARAFAQRTLEVVGAGRALCPLCGNPMDPDGHVCPAADEV